MFPPVHPLSVSQRPAAGKGGFALVVVLSAILILTALFAVTLSRLKRQMLGTAIETALLERRAMNRQALDVVMVAALAGDFDPSHALPWRNGTIMLQDVGGLIDLNTANPRLIEALFDHLGLSPSALDAYRGWRREGRRFRSLEAFVRITGAPETVLAKLPDYATVFSGRIGIAPEVAPATVLSLMTQAFGPGDLPSEIVSPPSRTNFDVSVAVPSGTTLRAGTLFLADESGTARILALR